jgi:peptidoglycan/xylan/chitin deacetylase (PgdA/CDA1 family)
LPPFTIQADNGRLGSWSPGKPTLITFCAFWCDTWKTQLKRLYQAQQEVRGLPVNVLAISVDGQWTELGNRAPYLKQMTTLKDSGGAWSKRMGIDKVPFTMVADSSGKLLWVKSGIARSDEMAAELRSAMHPQTQGGTIYLTFDDFPKGDSEALLDTLRRLNAPATFFCIGSRAVENADLLKQALRMGDSVQVHAWIHDLGTRDLPRAVEAITKATGQKPTLYRPPGSESIFSLDGRHLPYPEVDPYDFQRPGVKELLRRILLAVRPGAVIQLHAGVSETLAAMPEIVRSLRARGFTFATLE